MLAEYGGPQCVFATNTLTLSIDEITEYSNCKDRVIGMHFFRSRGVPPYRGYQGIIYL